MGLIERKHNFREKKIEQLALNLAHRDKTGEPGMLQFVKEQHTTYSMIHRTRESEPYKAALREFDKAQLRVMKEDVKEFTQEIRKKLREYSDQAPDVLYRIMMDEAEKAPARISAASELLDRDGRFAKVSRTMAVQPGQDGAPLLPEDAAQRMLEALDQSRPN